jgi:hypothetical protein
MPMVNAELRALSVSCPPHNPAPCCKSHLPLYTPHRLRSIAETSVMHAPASYIPALVLTARAATRPADTSPLSIDL